MHTQRYQRFTKKCVIITKTKQYLNFNTWVLQHISNYLEPVRQVLRTIVRSVIVEIPCCLNTYIVLWRKCWMCHYYVLLNADKIINVLLWIHIVV
jgi:hypothetical protein